MQSFLCPRRQPPPSCHRRGENLLKKAPPGAHSGLTEEVTGQLRASSWAEIRGVLNAVMAAAPAGGHVTGRLQGATCGLHLKQELGLGVWGVQRREGAQREQGDGALSDLTPSLRRWLWSKGLQKLAE